MKTLYLDLFSGISGDMFLGALFDLGLDSHRFEHEMEKLGLIGYHLHVTRGQQASIAGVKFDVHLENHGHGEHQHPHDEHHEHTPADKHAHSHAHSHGHDHGHGHAQDLDHEHAHGHAHEHSYSHACSPASAHGHESEDSGERTFAQIREIIAASGLSDWAKDKSIAIFRRIANAEGKIHGLPPEQVHFHEVGALDSIVDIVGACVGLEMLGHPRVLASPVTEGVGWIDCAHGRFPIPAPATLAILGERGIPLSQCQEPHELVTPTGAALLAELVETFGPMQGLVAEKIGFGLGSRRNETRPNVLRAILGESSSTTSVHDWETDTVCVLETNLDDLNSEILGAFMEQALAAGALDVFHTAIQMKKSRPGVLLTILCTEADADKFAELLLRETSAFGVRRYRTERRKLAREFRHVQTPYGQVTVKIGRLDGHVIQAAPEFESCKAIAAAANVPLKNVYEAALRALGPESTKPGNH
jgi:uncharacterized protein (TIGR00299 family) protein